MHNPKPISPILKWFLEENQLDLCVELTNQFGKFFPQVINNMPVKKGVIRQLLAKGYIERSTVEVFGVSYQRFKLSNYARKYFE